MIIPTTPTVPDSISELERAEALLVSALSTLVTIRATHPTERPAGFSGNTERTRLYAWCGLLQDAEHNLGLAYYGHTRVLALVSYARAVADSL